MLNGVRENKEKNFNMEDDKKTGCLIATLLVLGGVLLCITFAISDINPEMETIMLIIGAIIIAVFGYIIFNID